MPIIFVIAWLLCQWALWIFGAALDAVSPIIGPIEYDPRNIGFLQKLFRDLVPPAAAMLCAAWAASKFSRSGQLGYRLGATIIVVGLSAIATFTTWSVIERNLSLSWGDLVLDWATVAVVAACARWARP